MNYAESEDILKIMKGIAKKAPQGIMNGDTQVGHITWQMYLMKDYLKLDGTPLANAGVDYKDLLKFAQDNNLIIADTTDKSLFKYDSTTDVLTLPDYILSSGEIGSILSYMGNTVPTSYLACDGTVYNITEYQELADFINNEFGTYNHFGGDGITTFAVPDLRGEFLRGTGTNSHTNQGSGANVGVHQDGTYNQYILADDNAVGGLQGTGSYNRDSNLRVQGTWVYAYTGTVQANTIAYYTSRPTNTSVLYCIKYTNTFIPQIKYKKSTTVWETVDIGKFVATAPAHYEREQLFTTNRTTVTIYPTWVNVDGSGYVLNNQITLNINEATSWDDSQYATAANRAGKDFFIYACKPVSDYAPKFILSINSTVPTGYTANDSRKIGGFHCLCVNVGTISGHTLSGYVAGDILPNSPWDLDFRAESENNGMVYIPQIGLWADIYLGSWDGLQIVSEYNGTPITGISSKPMHGIMLAENYGLVNKFLPSYDEFIVCAKGSPEGDHLSTGAARSSTGGHVATGGKRIISNYGLEDCVGVLWQWGRDLCETTPNTGYTSGNYWVDGLYWIDNPVYNPTVDTVKRGSCYGLLRRLMFGGGYSSAVAACGSRAVSANYFGSRLHAAVGGRGFSRKR